MPHTALYRKKRPRTFGSVVGQPHIVRALLYQLKTEQVSHAYLFCGTRGTGKTSAAKIFARAVNCLAPVDGEPCNVCDICKDILADRLMDVQEIDAASNNGVENIRELREEVNFMPTLGKYKVYIIDEVHMLSTSAFNALLKTLEEPPQHVIFILATTDPQKIPATILSRCQRYDFRRISISDMTATLKAYLQAEGVHCEDDALDYIAYHSDGAMRDALSLLDQCLSYDSAEGLTLERVRDLLGAVDRALLFEMTDALMEEDSGKLMIIISDAMDSGRDVSQFASDLVRHLRDVLVATLTPGDEFASEMADRLKAQGSRVPAPKLMEFIRAFSEIIREMRFAPHARTAFEVCALGLVAGGDVKSVPAAPAPASQPKPPKPEPPKSELPKPEPPKSEPQITPPAVQPPVSSPQPSAPGNQPPTLSILSNWRAFCQSLKYPLRSHILKCSVEEIGDTIKFTCDKELTVGLLKPKQAEIADAIKNFYNLPSHPNLAFEVKDVYNKPAAKPIPRQPEQSQGWSKSQPREQPQARSQNQPPPQSQVKSQPRPQDQPPEPPYVPDDFYATELSQPTIMDDWDSFGTVVENEDDVF